MAKFTTHEWYNFKAKKLQGDRYSIRMGGDLLGVFSVGEDNLYLYKPKKFVKEFTSYKLKGIMILLNSVNADREVLL